MAATIRSSLREQFPALHQQVRGHPLVYLDNAATTHKPRRVIHRISRFYERDNSNVHRGLHELSNRATAAFEAARERTALFLNARSAREIVWTRGTTAGINLVARCLSETHIRAGDRILLTEMEHHSNLVPWQLAAARTGATLAFVPVTPMGTLDLTGLDALLAPPTKLFAFTHISNTLGTVNDAAALCRRARESGVLSLVDAAQSAGHAPLDVRGLGCDFLVFSGHKTCGPTGIGVLYGRSEVLDRLPPDEGGGEMIESVSYRSSDWKPAPWRFEAGTPSVADAIGLAEAFDFLEEIGRAAVAVHDAALAEMAWEHAVRRPWLRVYGPPPPRAGMLTFNIDGIHAHDVVEVANHHGVALRGGHHCNQPLLRKLGAHATARASFYLYNTEQEVERLFDVLDEVRRFFS